MKKTVVDIVILGGGMAGVGCAAMLPESLSVVLLEGESQCGYHSTGRSAAAWVAGYGGPEIQALTRNSESYLVEPPAELNEESFLSPRGEMLLASTDIQQHALQEQIASIDHLRQISVAKAYEKVPVLNEDCLLQVAYTSEAYDIDADRLLQAWIRLGKQRRFRVLTEKSVNELQRKDGYWQVICSDGDEVLAKTVVNATGAWADKISELAGLGELGLIPHRRSAALLPAMPEHNVTSWPLVIAADESWYARPMGNKLMVSPADETPVSAHDAFAEDLTIACGLDRFEKAVNISITHVESTWAGLRTFAPDRVPVVGFDPRSEGFFWLAGQGGYGIQTAPALSRLAAELLTGSSSVMTDETLLARLSPERLICA